MQTMKLFNDADYTKRAQLLLKNLDSTDKDIKIYDEKLTLLSSRLDDSDAISDFFAVVEDIIKVDVEIDRFLLTEKGINKKLKDYIMIEIKDKSEFQPFYNILNFNKIISEKILQNKERLSLSFIKTKLSEDDYQIAEKFINSIQALKPFAKLMEEKKNQFIERLSTAVSIAEVDEIEQQIDKQGTELLNAYQTLINFPDDENIAGYVIKYLETNDHIRSIMQSFDFAESLTDDILSAKSSKHYSAMSGSK